MTKQAIDVVCVANVAEAFCGQIESLHNEAVAKWRAAHESALSQRALYWGGNNKLVVTSEPIPQALIDHAKEVLGWRNVVNISVERRPLRLSQAIVSNPSVLEQISGFMRSESGAELSAYCVTEDFLTLAGCLRAMDCNVIVGWPPGSPHSVRDRLDTKSGFRLVAQDALYGLDGIGVPDGFICKSIRDAWVATNHFTRRSSGCVIKADTGESGWGTLILRGADASSVTFSGFANRLEKDEIWSYGNIVVEEYLEADSPWECAFPSIEIFVSGEGPQVTYGCQQLVDTAGVFQGVVLDDSRISAITLSRMQLVGNRLGWAYFEKGYRGYFDVDFVTSQGKLFALETNMRRTGGTHVFDLAMALSNVERRPQCLLSEDSVRCGMMIATVGDLLVRTKDLMFPINAQNRGIFLTYVSIELQSFGYVVCASSYEDALKQRQTLHRRVGIST